jgi:hypothetical protein
MPYNIASDLAQELAEYVDDLRGEGGGVTCYAQDAGLGKIPVAHPVEEVGDAEQVEELRNTFFFRAVIKGRKFTVSVVEIQE